MTSKELLWQKWMDRMSRTCHQLPERSFFYHGWQFPVCARCTGMYLGYVLGFSLLLIQIHLPLFTCLFGCFLMWFDWYLQHRKILLSNNGRRLLTGIWAGTSILQIIGQLVIYLLGMII